MKFDAQFFYSPGRDGGNFLIELVSMYIGLYKYWALKKVFTCLSKKGILRGLKIINLKTGIIKPVLILNDQDTKFVFK